ncbi:DUF402 domain-containing protein [Amycolatopsis suaedae]|uniref:DUF402 domain-containing protein n=1 Tax=Amycolatopsis suaedae TaxID=2510978 RepID=UPI0013EF557B|nr:DUF402 domain-containing protein [Amycolatopsis suaedae]
MTITVRHRILDGAPRPAVLVGDVLISDEPATNTRHGGDRRIFWLLDVGVQLVWEAFRWEREWYVDMVRIDREGDTFHVTDQYLDFVVPGMGPAYRVLDLDELGDAVRDGHLSVADSTEMLTRAQRFLDTYLHRGAVFPPPPIRPYFAADHRYPDITG